MLVFVSFFIGLMAKPMLVTLPFVLLLLDYWPLGRISFSLVDGYTDHRKEVVSGFRHSPWNSTIARLIVEKIPLIILAVFSCIITFYAQKNGQAVVPLDTVSFDYRMTNALISGARYIEKTFWPKDLAIFYPYVISIFSPWRIVWSLFLLAGITVVVIRWIRRYPYLLFGWLWYLGTLVPVIGFVQVGPQAMADRYTYISLIGIFMMISWGYEDILKNWRYRTQLFLLTSGLVISILMVLTWTQVQNWKNSITIFEHTLRVTEGNYLSHNNLGVALFQDGRLNEAKVHFEHAFHIKTDYFEAYNNMGLVLGSLGKVDEAIMYYHKTLKIKPDYTEALNNLGVAFASKGEMVQAINHYSEALKVNPNYFSARYNLGLALLSIGRYNDAIVQFTEALRINRDAAMVHNNLGIAYANIEKLHEASLHFNEALRINPRFAEAYRNLQYVQERLTKQ